VFKVSDGVLESTPATVDVTVTPVNDAPTAQPQSVTTSEDVPVSLTLSAADIDGDALTWTIVAQPTHGTLSGTAPNYTYTPSANYAGTDSFAFKVSDGVLESAPATVDVTVTPVNDAPTAQPQSVTTSEDLPASFTLSAADIDGDALTWTITAQPTHGTLSGTAPNYTYTPNANFSGTDSFVFKVSDGVLESGIVVVGIDVSPVNDAPVALDQTATGIEDTPLEIELAGL
jgi:hypothetical protein